MMLTTTLVQKEFPHNETPSAFPPSNVSPAFLALHELRWSGRAMPLLYRIPCQRSARLGTIAFAQAFFLGTADDESREVALDKTISRHNCGQ